MLHMSLNSHLDDHFVAHSFNNLPKYGHIFTSTLECDSDIGMDGESYTFRL